MGQVHNINQLAQLVETHRRSAGLTQVELANMADVGKTLIYNIENGHNRITLEKLLSVLKVLNINIQLTSPDTPK